MKYMKPKHVWVLMWTYDELPNTNDMHDFIFGGIFYTLNGLKQTILYFNEEPTKWRMINKTPEKWITTINHVAPYFGGSKCTETVVAMKVDAHE